MGKNDDDCAEKKLEEEIKNSPILNDTEKQVIIKARIGQGKYRDNLMKSIIIIVLSRVLIHPNCWLQATLSHGGCVIMKRELTQKMGFC